MRKTTEVSDQEFPCIYNKEMYELPTLMTAGTLPGNCLPAALKRGSPVLS